MRTRWTGTWLKRVGRAAAVLIVAASSLGSAGPAAAQERPGRDRLEAEIRARFNAVVKRELGLEDGTLARLDAELETLQEDRRELGARQRQLRRRMASTGTLLSDEQARSVLDELVTVQEAELALLRREQERLLQVLTPPQLVRFYTLRERFADRVRELRRRRPGGERGPETRHPVPG